MATETEPASDTVAPATLRECLCIGAFFYSCTTAIVIGAVVFGGEIVPRRTTARAESSPLLSGLSGWDGAWYAGIVENGYSNNPDRQSNVAFFPVFPLLGMVAKRLTGASTMGSLLIVSHLSLLASFAVMAHYLALPSARSQNDLLARSTDSQHLSLLAYGLWPTSFFFRAAYTESVFLMFALVAFVGMRRNWRTLWIALAIGLATATRAVGVALIAPMILHLWNAKTSRRSFAGNAGLYGTIACWGIAAWMLYQSREFGDAFAFMKAHRQWGLRPELPPTDHLERLLFLEPLWDVYLPGSQVYWADFEATPSALFSLQAANPVYFLATVGLVWFGAMRGWLRAEEILLSAGMLLIPYVTHAYRAGMMGEGRYAAAIFPAYIVAGRLLARCPPPFVGLFCAASACLLAMYTALFAAWYRMI